MYLYGLSYDIIPYLSSEGVHLPSPYVFAMILAPYGWPQDGSFPQMSASQFNEQLATIQRLRPDLYLAAPMNPKLTLEILKYDCERDANLRGSVPQCSTLGNVVATPPPDWLDAWGTRPSTPNQPSPTNPVTTPNQPSPQNPINPPIYPPIQQQNPQTPVHSNPPYQITPQEPVTLNPENGINPWLIVLVVIVIIFAVSKFGHHDNVKIETQTK